MNAVPIYQKTNELRSLVEAGQPSVRLQRMLSSEVLASKGVDVSLLVLPEQPDCHFAGQIGTTAMLANLPLIIRDGVSPPWMDARSLGLSGDRVVSRVLMRTGSAFFRRHSLIAEALGIAELIMDNSEQLTEAHKCNLQQILSELQAHDNCPPLKEIDIMDFVTSIGSKAREIELIDSVGNIEVKQALEALRLFSEAKQFTFFTDFLREILPFVPHWSLIQGLGDLSMNAWHVAYFGKSKSSGPVNTSSFTR